MSARAANNCPGAHPGASETVSESSIDHGKRRTNALPSHKRARDSSLLGAGFAHGGGGCRGRLRGRAGTSGTAAAALCIPPVPPLRRGCRRPVDRLLPRLGQPWRRWIRLLRCARICAKIAPSAELRPATAMSRRASRGRTSTARAGLWSRVIPQQDEVRALDPSALLMLTARAGCSESGPILCPPERASGAGAGLQPSVGRRGPRSLAAGPGGCVRRARQVRLRVVDAQQAGRAWPSQQWVQKHTTLAKPEMATIPRQLIIVEMHRGLASGVGRTRRDDGRVSVWWW